MSNKQSPADLNKDTQTLDMFAELFDPQVVSDFVNHSQRMQPQPNAAEESEKENKDEQGQEQNENADEDDQ